MIESEDPEISEYLSEGLKKGEILMQKLKKISPILDEYLQKKISFLRFQAKLSQCSSASNQITL